MEAGRGVGIRVTKDEGAGWIPVALMRSRAQTERRDWNSETGGCGMLQS